MGGLYTIIKVRLVLYSSSVKTKADEEGIKGLKGQGVTGREIEKVTKALEHRECWRWQEAAIELCNLRS